jgi:hypothetical protein
VRGKEYFYWRCLSFHSCRFHINSAIPCWPGQAPQPSVLVYGAGPHFQKTSPTVLLTIVTLHSLIRPFFSSMFDLPLEKTVTPPFESIIQYQVFAAHRPPSCTIARLAAPGTHRPSTPICWDLLATTMHAVLDACLQGLAADPDARYTRRSPLECRTGHMQVNSVTVYQICSNQTIYRALWFFFCNGFLVTKCSRIETWYIGMWSFVLLKNATTYWTMDVLYPDLVEKVSTYKIVYPFKILARTGTAARRALKVVCWRVEFILILNYNGEICSYFKL